MKKFVVVLVILLCCGMRVEAAETSAGVSIGEIATEAYPTLEPAHEYYVEELGQSCAQCGIEAKDDVKAGDYGCGILAHGEVEDVWWMIMEDTHYLIVNGNGDVYCGWDGYKEYVEHGVQGALAGDVGSGAYSGLTNLESFVWAGDKCSEVGSKGFYGDEKLAAINLADSIKRIGKQAFVGCSSLKQVEFGGCLEYIEARAFRGIPIEKCEFPPGLKSIGVSAFAKCMYLRDIYWGETRCYVGKLAFNNCKGLGYRTVGYLPSYLVTEKNSFRNCGGEF